MLGLKKGLFLNIKLNSEETQGSSLLEPILLLIICNLNHGRALYCFSSHHENETKLRITGCGCYCFRYGRFSSAFLDTSKALRFAKAVKVFVFITIVSTPSSPLSLVSIQSQSLQNMFAVMFQSGF